MSRHSDTRAVSVTVSYAITLGITAILISLLLLSAGNLLEDQRQQATRAQLQNVGGQFAQEIHYVDELDDGLNGSANATVSATLPGDISGIPYSVEIKPYQISDGTRTEAMLYLNSTGSPDVDVRIPLGNETAVVPADEESVSLETGRIDVRVCRGTGPAYPDDGQLIVFRGSCP
ncbi:hypothetical protein GJ629_04360 [Halapricum sp. CBA1109]|uniref:DUF7266 family protein n=1 Tax=Halapricum sp. CBA1109 TaxID=2668068 RepID=UPI0012FC0236|nr:hypothetical protein [Halapricum sp. CBA1109]MUV89224.1 hypothetical protein [Halapricum sp. CBA1109]